MADKPSEKKDALRDALDEIDQRVVTPKYAAKKQREAAADAAEAARTASHRSIEERRAAALARLAKAYNKGASEDVQEEIEKINTIAQANAANIGPIVSDVKTIGSAAKTAVDTATNAKAAYKTVKSKLSADAGRLGAQSIIGKAAQNLFEFPVFISSSVPLEYATAVNSLLEQMYASFLQMAVSINPVVSAKDVASGKMFQHLKTDVTKYMEYTDFDWARAACHNVVYMEDATVEFNMINISAEESNLILEAANYEELSEFDHFFQEASHKDQMNEIDRLTQQVKDLEDEEDGLEAERRKATWDPKGDDAARLREVKKELSSARRDLSNANRSLDTKKQRASQEKERKANEAERKANEAERKANQAARDAAQQWRDEESRKNQEHREAEKAANQAQRDKEWNHQLSREQQDDRYRAAREKREEEDHIINRNRNKRESEQHAADMKVKAPQLLDESKIQKLNTMKPLMMTVGFKVLSDSGQVSDMIDYIVGVRTHCRIVKAEILPDVAEYPLKEMSTLTRKAKWRAGEIKFLDFLFAKKEKKQAAYDSRDVNRKWYHRLYTLAHSKGSKSIAGKITGKSANGGVIPNATIVMTKADVDMIKAEKGIDLLRPGSARAFCSELFLMSFIVIDVDASSIKILLPDINNDFEVQSLSAVQKQIATLDTAGTVADEVKKLMSGR